MSCLYPMAQSSRTGSDFVLGLCALRVHAEHTSVIGRVKESNILVRHEYAASIGQTLIRVSSDGSGIWTPRKVYVDFRFHCGTGS